MNTSVLTPHLCPVCGAVNACQLATNQTYKGQCWCMKAELPRGVELPAELCGLACLCEGCFNRVARGEPVGQVAEGLEAGRDYYIENGAVVFTSEYLTRRVFCCDSGCRHCPY